MNEWSRRGWMVAVMMSVGSACTAWENGAAGPSAESAPPDERVSANPLHFSGTVVWMDLEGGFYGLVSDDGRKFQPVGKLPAALAKDGLKVEGRLRLKKDFVSFRMWGEPVEIVDLRRAAGD